MLQSFISKSEIETFNIAKNLSKKLASGDVVLLEGPLGAGKSIFIRGILKGLGINENVPSPTFTLVNEYKAAKNIYHFDLYRINDPYELYEIGFEEYIYSDGISLIEWASKAGELVPDKAMQVDINIISDNERKININWKNPAY